MQFHDLEPDMILDAVEDQMDVALTGLCTPYASYINRVFELLTDDGESYVIKLYRPDRWSYDAIADEHDFLFDLQEQGVGAVAPYALANGESLGEIADDDGNVVFFAVFPKKGGRSYSEFNREQWIDFGRLLGRVHRVGAEADSEFRLSWQPQEAIVEAWDWVVSTKLMPQTIASDYAQCVAQLVDRSQGKFDQVPMQRIHGDCHRNNVLYRPDTGMFLIDFDDMVTGPIIQDLWMMISGTIEESEQELDWFREGYSVFNDLDTRQFDLIEPLRAMRFVHYMAWNTRQFVDDGVAHVAADFNTAGYWENQLRQMQRQVAKLRL